MSKIVAAALLAFTVTVPADAASASCSGLSPLQLTCTTNLTPATANIDVLVTTGVTFVGSIEVRLRQGELGTAPLECPRASVVTSDCRGHVHGQFAPGARIDVEAEVFSIDGLTPSIGEWSVTVTG